LNHSTTSHATAPKDAAMSVFRNATAVIESTRNSLPALKPYHPNQSRPVPSATSGMLCGPFVGHAPLAHVEHGCQGRHARDIVHHNAAREILHAPGASSPPPHTMWTNGKYTHSSHAVRNSGVSLERDPVGKRARDQRRGDDGEHHLIGAEHESAGIVSFGEGVDQRDPSQERPMEVADDAGDSRCRT
jgi:hypothetical protein